MMPLRSAPLFVVLVAAASCGGGGNGIVDPPPPPPPSTLPTPTVACTSVPVTQLAVGAHQIIDPAASSGCLRVPQAGPNGAQYLVVLTSTSSIRTSSGVSGPYLLRASSPGVSASPSITRFDQPVVSPRSAGLSAALAFDARLRDLERELAANPANRRVPETAPRIQAAPPVVGDVRSFKSCSTLACTAVVTVQATAKYVGTHAAIYVDNAASQTDPLQTADLNNLGGAFDTRHYPIDTTAFGRESDVDGNGVVLILMTPAVNNLTPDCTDGRVVGYFFGGDLLPGFANSNNAEIFYTLVPAPATTKCTAVTRAQAVSNLKPTLIHEFQHMISYNQHVLLRSGSSESTWLNEGLSHFAEELGGREIPDAECLAEAPSCRSLYTSGDIFNSYDYLKSSESHFLIYPSGSFGTLEERGSAWIFLRWAFDQFSSDAPLSTSLTRKLDASSLLSVENLISATGGSFSTMVPEWLMSTYLDDDASFVDPTGRLAFTSWGLRGIWTDPRNASFFPSGFPIVPDVLGPTYSRAGTLRGGSGRHFLITQAASGPALDVRVLANLTGAVLDAALVARYGITRIR